jgi:2-deoxy-D-gluconate 3-dehydrogenase
MKTGRIPQVRIHSNRMHPLTVPAYAASKGAVAQFTKALSNEWAGQGINLNCIAPGYVHTEMNTALLADLTRSRQILDAFPPGAGANPRTWSEPSSSSPPAHRTM